MSHVVFIPKAACIRSLHSLTHLPTVCLSMHAVTAQVLARYFCLQLFTFTSGDDHIFCCLLRVVMQAIGSSVFPLSDMHSGLQTPS